MSIDADQQLTSQTAGQADWDSGLNANNVILARGYHTVARAGLAINTADVLWMNPTGFWTRFDPNSTVIIPHGLAYTSAASGDTMQVILRGIARGMVMSTTTPFDPGKDYFVSAQSPGLLVTSYAGATWLGGFGVRSGGVYFNPQPVPQVGVGASSSTVAVLSGALSGRIDIVSSNLAVESGALSARIDTQVGRVDTVSSNLAVESGALSARIDTVSSNLAVESGALSGRIDTTSSNLAIESGALSARIDALSASVGGGTAVGISSLYSFLVTTLTAGAAINTGYVVWQNSGANAFHFDPNSADIKPHALAFTGATGVGSLFQVVLRAMVHSIVPTSATAALIPGLGLFVSVLTPGMAVHSYSAANRRIGRAFTLSDVHFDPDHDYFLERLSKSTTITVNPTSTHLFILDVGKSGIVHDLLMKSNSADKMGLAFYSNSARSDLMYQTASGGVTTVSSFVDRALWPYDNTDASTLSGNLYGKIWPDSGAIIASQDIQVQLIVDRMR